MTRRELVSTVLKGGLITMLADFSHPFGGGNVMAQQTEEKNGPVLQLPPAYRGENKVQSLPFNAAKLNGLSEKLIISHHQNNYAGAVNRLNQIQKQIGGLAKNAPPYQMGSLKREEIIATNSMVLHEFYFNNLGGDGKPSGTIINLINAHYGSVGTWEQEFRLAGMSLGGGSGWVILNYSYRDRIVHNYWAGDHTQSLAWGVPLLVMDMYEHAYAMDYGTNARGYIDAFFQNVNWDDVNRRAEAAQRG
jgi:superoxide dismutase, Fe-Mn family